MNLKWFDRSVAPRRVGVHPTAIIGPDVSLDEGAEVGAYCVLDGRVKIGAGTSLQAHCVVHGTTFIGGGCRIGPHATIGGDPQHMGYDGKETYLVIEDGVVVREYATVHRATKSALENATRVGRGSLLMVGSHVGHDCRLGENVTLANAVQLGGHVVIGDRAFIGGGTVVHQSVRVGRLAIIGGGEAISKDVLPFGAVFRGGHKGYNAVGCRRARLEQESLRGIRAAFHEVHSHLSPMKAASRLREIQEVSAIPEVREVIEFIESTRRGIQQLKGDSNREAAE